MMAMKSPSAPSLSPGGSIPFDILGVYARSRAEGPLDVVTVGAEHLPE
jgi:hypothetical protein